MNQRKYFQVAPNRSKRLQTFSTALRWIRRGRPMRRRSWSTIPHAPHIVLRKGQNLAVGDVDIEISAHLVLVDRYGRGSPYTPSQEDLLANDWMEVKP